MVSSSNLQSDVRDCYELGANSFVVKQLGPLSPGRIWWTRSVTGSN